MSGDRRTRAALNRAVRQEALREQLAAQGHVQHVVDLVDKIGDESNAVQQDMLARYKIVLDTKMKLIGKYLPDLKAQEITGEGGERLVIPTLSSAEAEKINKTLDSEY